MLAETARADVGARPRVREYLETLGRVERVGTVILFLSRREKEVAREAWEAVGVARGDSDAGGVWKSIWQ